MKVVIPYSYFIIIISFMIGYRRNITFMKGCCGDCVIPACDVTGETRYHAYIRENDNVEKNSETFQSEFKYKRKNKIKRTNQALPSRCLGFNPDPTCVSFSHI